MFVDFDLGTTNDASLGECYVIRDENRLMVGLVRVDAAEELDDALSGAE